MSAASSLSLSVPLASRAHTVLDIPLHTAGWERYVRATPGGSLQGSVEVAFERRNGRLWGRLKPIGNAPTTPVPANLVSPSLQPSLTASPRAGDAPPPIDIDVDDLCYAIFGIDPDGDQVSTAHVSVAGMQAILVLSGAVIYLAGTVPAALQLNASYNRLSRLGADMRMLKAAQEDAPRDPAIQAIMQRTHREMMTERSRFTFAGMSAAVGTFLAGTSSFMKLAPHTGDSDEEGKKALTLVRRSDGVLGVSKYFGTVGVGLIGLYGVGTGVQCGVSCAQYALQKTPTANDARSPWRVNEADVYALTDQARVRRRNHAAASALSYLGIGIGVPMTNWGFIKHVDAGLTLLMCGAAGAMASKFYTRQVLQYHKLVPLLERVRLNTLPKIYLEMGFVEQERKLLGLVEKATARGWGWQRADDNVTVRRAFNEFLVLRLQLEEQYWLRKPTVDDSPGTDAALRRCRQDLNEAQTWRQDEAPVVTVQRLLCFFDVNGLLGPLGERLMAHQETRAAMGLANKGVVTFSANGLLNRVRGLPADGRAHARDVLVRTAVTFLRSDYKHWRLGRRNELGDMAMDLLAAQSAAR